jgi:integrase
LQAARKKRDDARALLDDGVDPGAVRKEAKREVAGRAANSFEAVAREWYGKQAHIWVAHHASDVLRRLESNLFPEIGDKAIADITAPVLLAAVRKIEHRGAHDLAHRVLQVSSQVFRYGVATGRCARDPAPDLRGALTPHKGKHQAAVAPEELPALLRAIDGYGKVGDKLTGYALRLLVLTFVRTNELIGAEWSELDLDSAVWIIPASRMKMKTEHVVPLSRQSVEAFREVRANAGGSRYVFPGRNPDKPISNNTMLFALYRLGYKGRMTGHGFRSTFRDWAAERTNYPREVAEMALAHAVSDKVEAAYRRGDLFEKRRKLMNAWATYCATPAEPGKLIHMKRSAVNA